MKRVIFALLLLVLGAQANDPHQIVVIANHNVPEMDMKTIAKVFTGKVVKIDSVAVIPVLLNRKEVTDKFLQKFVGMEVEQFIAYWTVRQYIGKGTPPKKISSVPALIIFVKETPGAVSYINAGDLKGGDLNIISIPEHE